MRAERASLDRPDINGYALFDSITVTGKVWSPAASIRGQPILRGVILVNEGGKALLLA
jgi:hypothetical protein